MSTKTENKSGIKRVLLADDDELIRMLLSDFFSDMGFEVVEAINCANAVAVFEKQEFDIVVTDNSMPARNQGIELTQTLRSRGFVGPIYMQSGDEGVKDQFIRVGGTHFFEKTTGTKDLLVAMKEAA